MTCRALELPKFDDNPERSRGVATIAFSTKEAAESALQKHGEYMGDRWVFVGPSGKPPVTKDTAGLSDKSETLFVGNLSFEIDEDTLRNHFGQYGNVVSCRMATDRETGDFRGFAHVEYSSPEEAEAALESAGQSLLGRPLKLDFSTGKRNGGGGGTPRGRGGSFGGRGRGGDRGGRGRGGDRGGRGRGGDRGGRGRGGDRGGRGRGGDRGGRGRGGSPGGVYKKEGIAEFQGAKMTFD